MKPLGRDHKMWWPLRLNGEPEQMIRAIRDRRVAQQCCSLLDLHARSLDPGDGLPTATGPRCDVAEGVVARVE